MHGSKGRKRAPLPECGLLILIFSILALTKVQILKYARRMERLDVKSVWNIMKQIDMKNGFNGRA
jgi:hypothetical protein